MPRFDGTGPLGQGPLTGRGLGPCATGKPYGLRGTRPRFGISWGRRFWGNTYQQEVNPKSEKEMLKEESKALEKELEAIKKRLNEIK